MLDLLQNLLQLLNDFADIVAPMSQILETQLLSRVQTAVSLLSFKSLHKELDPLDGLPASIELCLCLALLDLVLLFLELELEDLIL